MNNKTIIYIAGYGRSGSTLLERILSSNEKIFGMGELSRLPDFIDQKSGLCSCGEELRNCKFWGKVLQRLTTLQGSFSRWERTQCQKECFTHFLQGLFNNSSQGAMNYATLTKRLFTTIFECVPKPVDYVVDSSKTARKSFFRPIALSRTAGLDVKVIHLVRDGRGCMWSNLKGSNRRMEMGLDPHIPFAALRTALSWPLANIAAHLFKVFHASGSYTRIRYENFVENPTNVLNKLGDFLGVDFADQIQMLKNQEPIPLSHQLAGNRLRSKERIILNKDVEWKEKLKLRHKLLFWLLDWPWVLLYGYW